MLLPEIRTEHPGGVILRAISPSYRKPLLPPLWFDVYHTTKRAFCQDPVVYVQGGVTGAFKPVVRGAAQASS